MGNQFVNGLRCGMSDPANPHTLSHGHGDNLSSSCYKCGEQKSPNAPGDFHYRCNTCDVEFHESCHECPRNIRHPFHYQHPLTLIESESESSLQFKECNWCGENIKDKLYYRCFICGFCLDVSCAKRSPPPTIPNSNIHHHSLVFFPRPYSLPCDACGLVNSSEPVFACFQCNYMVHQSCVDLPRVIKITRHSHRLSYTPYFPPDASTCKICYKTVDIKYGQYTCNQEGCSYVAHSRCATNGNIWDGTELEWEPEETVNIEDIEPFKIVGVNLIKYFCHDHHLKFQKYDKLKDVDKQCQACIFPIDSRDFYNFVECDFFLHEVCANLPRKLDHSLHRHPLVLEPSTLNDNYKTCAMCGRYFSGFHYRCLIDNCENSKRLVDIRCILVPDYFFHKSHEHPVFISMNTGSYRRGDYDGVFNCSICKSYSSSLIDFTGCDFLICYKCTTIPNEILLYKHDEHPLSLCCGKEVDETYWCEICEAKIESTQWFYTCTRCCVTIHHECILGPFIYMKPGYSFKYRMYKVEVIRNSSNTRTICYVCKKRCPHSIYWKVHEKPVCSESCFYPVANF